ncbi:unnamed protein product, partial [Cyprideis torosa]
QDLSSAIELANKENWPILIVGGGSNLILSQDYTGLVIRQSTQSIDYAPQGDGDSTHVTASAGVQWHCLVLDSVNRGLAGLENLSLIPGQVGAAPVQNIGAYGVELCDRFISLRALHLPSGEWRTLNAADCQFAYRDSLFKHHYDHYIITSVTLQLGSHLGLHTAYSAL